MRKRRDRNNRHSPTPNEMADAVVALLGQDDPADAIEALAQDPNIAGLAMVSLAHVASRPIAELAQRTDSRVQIQAQFDSGRPIPDNDPREFASLLLGTAANADDPGTTDIVAQVLQQGPQVTRQTIVVLLGMARYALAHQFFARQNPLEN